MPTADILLLQYVDGLGGEGDLVKVAAGYARNYLLPQGFAIHANHANRKQVAALQKAKADRERRDREQAEQLIQKLNKTQLAIAVRTGDQGKKLFGKVDAHTLIKRLAEDGIELQARQFHWGEPVKALGQYTVAVKLCEGLMYDLKYEVFSENTIEEAPVEEQPVKEKRSRKAPRS